MFDLRWRRIDSAPMDGTKIHLGWFDAPGRDVQAIGHWDEKRRTWMAGQQVAPPPTHWMPRPKPPAPFNDTMGVILYLVARDTDLREALLRPLDERERRVTAVSHLNDRTNRDVLVVFPGWERFFDIESRFAVMQKIITFPGERWMSYEWF